MWFNEYTLETSERKKWDCKNCMENNLHKTIRNCEGKFPQSHWAKNGYDIGPVKINQCPKSFQGSKARKMIEAFDNFKHLQLPFYQALNEVPNQFVELSRLIENERSLIRQDRNLVKKHGK